MKKNIVLPIISAILVAVVAVVVSEIIIRNEKNIWCDAGAVRASLGGDEKFITTNEPETYDLVYSRAELLLLCKKYENHYLSEDRIDCDCKLCARLDGYDDDYFKDKALIIYQQCIGRGSMFAINQIYVSEDGTLVLSLYDALSLYDEMHSDISNFIGVKKSDIKEVASKELIVTKIWYSQLPEYKKVIKIDGEPYYTYKEMLRLARGKRVWRKE